MRAGARTRAGAALLALACAHAVAAAPAPAPARAPLATVVQDDAQLLHRSDAETVAALDRLQGLGVDTVRVTAGWSVLTRAPEQDDVPADFDQADPAAYEQARFAALDRLVTMSAERGLRILMDVGFWAPHWASADEPGPRARTQIDADAYGRFARALARRYSGSFTPPPAPAPLPPTEDEGLLDRLFGSPPAPLPATGPSPGPLPRVSLFSVWNEPNHPAFLLPQRARGTDGSPAVYRAMVRAAHAAVRAAQPGARVLIGGLASKGTNGRGVPPLRFVRELACVDRRLRPLRTPECRDYEPLPGDGFTAHPYSLSTPPDARPSRRQADDLPLGALPRLSALLRRLVAAGRISRGLREVWITEYGYETNPPAATTTFGLEHQVRFLPWAEYLAWRDPQVRSHAQFLLHDLPPAATRQGASERRQFGQWESGLLFADGRPKPAADGFAAGLFARPLTRARGARARTAIWGRVRPGGAAVRRVVLEVRSPGGRWRTLPSAPRGGRARTASFSSPGVFDRVVPAASVPRGALLRLRARVAGTTRTSPAYPVLHRPSPLG